ncbi:EAL domain-containing protein [Massilia sp. W12]|uniref:EAL domain-containing protein n=1 Tax=Massilia sp. W12 TaxID=3126507 RepID=UPI0030D5F233
METPGRQTLKQDAAGIFLLAVGYFLLGRLALMLALPPGYASPIFPPAGLALACAFSSRLRWLPGVFLGALFLNLSQAADHQGLNLISVIGALLVTVACTLQAWAGASILLRKIKADLGNVHDVLIFLGVIPLICLISSSISVGSLIALRLIPADTLMSNWSAWWAGDSIGILLMAPLCWLWLGQPQQLWRRRRTLIGAVLCTGLLISALIYDKTRHWEHEQTLRQVHLHAQKISDNIQARLGEHERFLSVSTSIFDDDDHEISQSDFDFFAKKWLSQHPEVFQLYWAPHLRQDELSATEQRISAELGAPFQVHSKNNQSAFLLPITYLNPTGRNRQILGKDMLSDKEHAASMNKAISSKSVTACPTHLNGVRIVPWLQWMHVAVYPHQNRTREYAPGQVVGVLGLALDMDTWISQIFKQAQYTHYKLRLSDLSEAGRPFIILDTLQTPGSDDFISQIKLADRKLEIRINADQNYFKQNSGWESWIVLVLCLSITGVINCTMLILSGEQARTYELVQERTAHLQDREARLKAILHHATDAILQVSPNCQLISANQAARTLFGIPEEGVSNKEMCDLLVHEGRGSMEQLLDNFQRNQGQELLFTGRHANGHTFPLALAISQVSLPRDMFYVCVMRDLTEQQRAQEKIHHLAHHDPLTGLANRITLNLRLEQLLSISRRNRQSVAVMFIDIDHFKKINDTQGHQVGDLFLLEVAKRLQESVREADTIARFGGDEFICILPEQHSPDHVTMVANRIVQSLSMPYILHGLTLHSGASVGIAMYPNDGEDVKTLLKNADMAMYAAKAQGRGNFQFFSPDMNSATHERLMLENRLWEALEHQEFELFLQPQIDLQNKRLIGAEALIRWRHPDLGLVPPDKFIPVAEDSALIHPLGEWVLQRAIQLIASWQNTPLEHLRLALNLSARQCQISSLVPVLDRLLTQAGVAGEKLEMEITETAAMSDPEQTRELLRALRQRGIQVAIDDFGTGYSSLSYLKLFAIDRIKIDRSFVKDIETDPNDAVIVSATIALAHSLGLEVIAEGVESAAQCEFLRNRGCDEAQGYYFARPLPLIDFIAFAQAHQQAQPPTETGQA